MKIIMNRQAIYRSPAFLFTVDPLHTSAVTLSGSISVWAKCLDHARPLDFLQFDFQDVQETGSPSKLLAI